MTESAGFRVGVLSAVAAHVMWGLFPLYWKQLEQVPSDQLVFHRFLWAFVILSLVVPLAHYFQRSRNPPSPTRIFSRRVVAVHALAAVLISVNWFAFLWAVKHDAVLQASLGYYINPLFNVLLGVVILGERLLPAQWLALAVAGAGVGVMTVATGSVPWVALAMATSFAFYGLVKKRTSLSALPGLWLEMLVFLPLSLGFLLVADGGEPGSMSMLDGASWALLIGGGVITVMPLTLFAVAARRVPLSLIGVLQYIGPTLQFLVGAVIYDEDLGPWRLAGFVLVWCGVGLYLQSHAWRAMTAVGRIKAVRSS